VTVRVVPLDTINLGNRSYLAHDGQIAVAVDVPRDVDRMIAAAAVEGVRIEFVLDTHNHGDWLTGGPALARLVGARYAAPAEIGAAQRGLTFVDGAQLRAGAMTLRARHTPGHTPGHMSYELRDGELPVGVFTGGSMLHGAVGRTDLVDPTRTEALAHAQFHSVRLLGNDLPQDTEVFPTHGFGSFCSATPTTGDASTIGQQRTSNPALTSDEGAFVATLLAGLDAYPAYYARMGPANRAGVSPIDLSPPAAVGGGELSQRASAGEWVVDLRSRAAFAAGHLPGSYNVDATGNAVTYLGWLMPAEAALTLLGDSTEQVAAVQRELALIGIERPKGATTGRPDSWTGGTPLWEFRRADFRDLAREWQPGLLVLDVRRHLEWRSSHISGAMHVPLHELADRLDEIPEGTIWVHCGSGFRAAIAASILDRTARYHPVLLDDDFENAEPAGLTLTASAPVSATNR